MERTVFILLIFFYRITLFSAEFELVNSEFSGIYYQYAMTKPCVTDLDGDGLLDLLVGGLDDDRIAHWEQSGYGSTTFIQRTPQFNGIELLYDPAPAVTDIDGDGLLDLIIGYGQSGIIGYLARYEQRSHNSTIFDFITSQFDGINSGYGAAPFFTDLDNDDKLDLLIGNIDGTIVRYEQIAANSTDFSLITSNFNSIDVGKSSAPFISDYNNDGLLDLLIGEEDGNINHYIQNSVNSTSFTLSTTTFSGIAVDLYSAPCITDINNDSYPDLLLGKWRHYIEHWSVIPPTVTTDNIAGITQNSCSSGVTVDAGTDIISAGVCWSVSQYPNAGGPHTADGNNAGHFISEVTGLTPNTNYYLRAYSKDNYTTVYGDQRSFKTLSFVPDSLPGHALDIDGGEYAEMPYSYEMNPDEFTVSFWVKAEDGQGTPRSPVTSRSSTTGFMFYASGEDRWEFWTRKGDSVSNKLTGPAVVLDEWVHIAGTYDGTEMCLYVNGEIAGRLDSVSYVPNTQYPLRIGAGYTEGAADYFFNGKIDEVKIWNIAKTAEGIRSDINIALTGTEPNLVSYWQFSDAGGNTLSDTTGNNDGLLINTEDIDWVGSTIPFGPGIANAKIVDAAEPVIFDGSGVSMDFTAKTGTDTIVVNKIEFPPNIEPGEPESPLNSQYWVIRRYGNGTFTTDISFTLNDDILENDADFLNSIRLYTRSNTSDSSWTYVSKAGYVNDVSNTVTFTGITEFGQMMITRYVLGVPQSVTATAAGGNLTITWEPVPNKVFYKIFASDEPYGTFVLADAVIGESWTTSFSKQKKFYYIVAVNEAK